MKTSRVVLAVLLAVLACTPMVVEGQPAPTSVTTVNPEDLLTSPVGANWTSYNGDYTGRRYSTLREINPANVHQLRAAWVFHPGNSQNLEVTPS